MKGFSAVLGELHATRDQVAAQLADLEAGIRIIEKLNGRSAPVDAKPAARLAPRSGAKTPQRKSAPAAVNGEASARREQLLALIGKSEIGLTVADLKKALPKMSSQDRSNALYSLKLNKQIRRAGNTWVKTGGT